MTALGLYYKWQTFFFIPLGALQTCIVPVISFNYAAGAIERCKKILSTSVLWGMALMAIGLLCFETIPAQMLHVFTGDAQVIEIGAYGFHWMTFPVTEIVTTLVGVVFYKRFITKLNK